MTLIVKPVRVEGAIAYVPLTRGFEALVDVEDAPLVSQWNWCVSGPGLYEHGGTSLYAMRRASVDGVMRTIKMHRLLFNASAGAQVDHINGNGLDNRKANLRFVTHAQNMQNRKMHRNNSTGYKGVYWDENRLMFQSIICANGHKAHLGWFYCPEQAHAAYAEASKRLHGEYGRLY